ncbi:MAG TPA: hypothetical protein VGP07_00470 [Polyangia bacterium]|jgi:hypothetical protein
MSVPLFRALTALTAFTLFGHSHPQPIIYACGVRGGEGPAIARVEVRALAKRGYELEVMHVDGPVHETQGMCSLPAYAIAEEATLIEVPPGTYALLAKAQDTASPYAFPLRGQVTVEGGHCYVPRMTCSGVAPPDGVVCKLELELRACARLESPRRISLPGRVNC